MKYAEIIIPLHLPRNYTWEVPPHMEAQLLPGCRVEVNLGKSKKYAGVVKNITEERPEWIDTKPILNILDVEPVLHTEQLKLWEWMASYYMCSEGDVMAAALPAHFKLSSESIIVFNEEFGDNFSELDHDEYLVAEALLLKKELRLNEVQQILDSAHVYPVINKLIHKKVCYVWEALKQTYSPRRETFVVLDEHYRNEENLEKLLNEDTRLRRAEKQMELLLAFLHLSKTEGDVSKSSLLKKSGASDAQLKGLADKRILQLEKRSVDRVRYLAPQLHIDFELSPAQQKALDELQTKMQEKAVCLLHGVTSSGKTQIYIKLIAEEVKKGKQVLFLLPEIALTSQIIRRLQKHFGGHIGIYHSRFTHNERVEIWNKVKSGELKVVLGARSALFLPFQDLSLVICDEEHDSSYKQQEPAPRYNGRDAAIFYASMFGAKTVLGSATPSFESYQNAVTGKYGLVEINERYGEIELPAIEMVDTRKIDRKDNNKIILTPSLITAINDTIAAGKQVILFQNRRGYSPYQICMVCGWIPQCRYCDVSLTYHKLSNQLHCHYCGSTYPPVHTCAACGNHQFTQRNFGTEKIEELLQETFPNANVARMDVDSVRGKMAHDNLIQQFEQQRIDILVGTQMVVKGLDFDHVGLVGILDADGLLHFADFRVHERAFQLMEQVSGRAGRKGGQGRVMIQTSQPAHPVLQYVKQHSYVNLFNEEIPKRKQFGYPPFTRTIHLSFRHRFREIAHQAAQQFANGLKNKYGPYMVGPAEPAVGRIRNLYLMELLLKLPRDQKLVPQCKKDIQDQIAILHQEKRFRSVVIIPDVDVV
ncbi:MAG: primosomal protein N' [Chitinophagaceae bacterium]|nr:primosomal protein N' [Chitinophagaceae bacterium]